jgi:hypothetical protein
MLRLNSSSAIAAAFLIPAAKEKESEQIRMRALKFVGDLSFREGNLLVSTPQNSTYREFLALSRSHYRIRHCSIAVALSCTSEVISVQIALKIGLYER